MRTCILFLFLTSLLNANAQTVAEYEVSYSSNGITIKGDTSFYAQVSITGIGDVPISYVEFASNGKKMTVMQDKVQKEYRNGKLDLKFMEPGVIDGELLVADREGRNYIAVNRYRGLYIGQDKDGKDIRMIIEPKATPSTDKKPDPVEGNNK